MSRAELARIPQTVAKNQPSLSVGVDDFDGLAFRALQDVARLDRPPSRHVLRRGYDSDHANRRGQLRDGTHGTGDSRAAGHVVFHSLHTFCRLDGDSARVEGNSFADQAKDGPRGDTGRIVSKDDEAWRLA